MIFGKLCCSLGGKMHDRKPSTRIGLTVGSFQVLTATLLGKEDSKISSKSMLEHSLGLLLGLSIAMGCKGCKCSTHHL
jgi:hypothetical protein